ncbi:hypothetical protein [Volucribacter amazonae]|uniref:Uncharacterized protein n=1 Tax=Volucribacter amazonae TaxID=256731 RepID=A0A9X4P7X8_9PAST|nr:hypothetical protein [Volucribacter amazonae]MDG6894290.1 hypothetical protein [Volucribacter amazonae]
MNKQHKLSKLERQQKRHTKEFLISFLGVWLVIAVLAEIFIVIEVLDNHPGYLITSIIALAFVVLFFALFVWNKKTKDKV